MAKKNYSNPDQLSFSYGRPLPALVEEIKQESDNTCLREAAEKMLEAITTFRSLSADQEDGQTMQAIHELLSK